MSEYKNDDYFQIYVKCLRPNQPVPFNCHILLKQSNRIILWIKRDHAITEEKYNKLQGHSIDKIYVRNDDKAEYFKYLDQFLSSDDGQKSLKEIKENNGAVKIEGLPSDEEYKLVSLGKVDPQDRVTVTGNVQVTDDNVAVRGGGTAESPTENFGKVNVEEEIEGPLGEVIRAIKSEVSDFERTAIRGVAKDLEDYKLIEDCTLRISDDLILVEDKLKKENSIDRHLVDAVKKRFQEQILIIRGKDHHKGNTAIQHATDSIAKQLEELQTQGTGKKINPRALRKKVKALKSLILSLNRLVKQDPHAVVSQTVSRMIGSVEQKLGQKLILDPQVGDYDELPEQMSRRLNLDDVMTAQSEDIKVFQHQIIKQNLLIQELDKRYKTNCQELQALRDKWYLFQVQAKKNLTGGDILLAKEIDKEFHKFENQFDGMQLDSNTLVNVTQTLTNEMGGKHIELDPQLLAEIGALSPEEQANLKSHIQKHDFTESSPAGTDLLATGASMPLATDENKAEPAETTTPTPEGDSQPNIQLSDLLVATGRAEDQSVNSGVFLEIEKIRSENEILKTQLENSQKLVEASGIKIDELMQLNARNNELTERLEEQNAEYAKVNSSLEEKVEKFQSAEDIYHDTLDGVHSEVKINQSEIEAHIDTIDRLKDQLSLLQNENTALKENAGLEDVLKEKDEYLQKTKTLLEQKQEEVQFLKKETVTVTAKLSESQQKLKHMSHKTDRMTAELEVTKKASRSAQAKAEAGANSLKQMRKTVSKLTEIADQLRKDRQHYILKTNEAMLKFETMTTEAASLNRQVEAHSLIKNELDGKLKAAENSARKLKAEVRRLNAEIALLQEQLDNKKAS